MTGQVVQLLDRGVLAISGDDRESFLQGLVTQDVTRIPKDGALYGCLLTPQGKFLYDFFLSQDHQRILLETALGDVDGLAKKLGMYKLRADVQIEDISSEFSVFVSWGDVLIKGGYIDPRLPEMGRRFFVFKHKAPDFDLVPFDSYDVYRIQHGVPDGRRDMIPELSNLLESNIDELGGISWDKGCYMGQELTARMKHRGLLKKRLFPVQVEGGEALSFQTPVLTEAGQSAGEIRSSAGGWALALLRLDRLDKGPLVAGGKSLKISPPDWLSRSDVIQ